MVVYWFTCTCLILGIALGIKRIYVSWNALHKYMSTSVNRIGTDELHDLEYSSVAIIIPVYDELAVIEKSIKNFMGLAEKGGIHIYYVTTEKEVGEWTTKDALKMMIKKYGLEENVHIIEYPNTYGVMAHQLNFAIKQLPKGTICFVYNVDSVIDIRTIDYVLKYKDYLKCGVFQQYSYSDLNTKNRIINSAILWQNRWMFSYELPKVLEESRKDSIFNFNYVIGHGLIFRKEIFDKFEHFSESDINEDNVLGYVLSIKHIPIYTIPYLEKVDFAFDTKAYLIQQETWFNGPLYAYKYYLDSRRKFLNGSLKLRLFWIASLNFRAALNWLFFPMLCIFWILLLSITGRWEHLFLLILLIILYVKGINEISNYYLKRYLSNEYECKKIVSLQSCFWLFVHTIGPIKTIIKVIAGNNTQKNKRRTPKI